MFILRKFVFIKMQRHSKDTLFSKIKIINPPLGGQGGKTRGKEAKPGKGRNLSLPVTPSPHLLEIVIR